MKILWLRMAIVFSDENRSQKRSENMEHTTKLYKQFEKRKKKKEKNELTEPGAQGVSGGEHARLGRYAAGAARVSAKRDPYLSKET